jgi:UDP-3-O-[3-hydroxymyristoyl] N-acetylglucosamine deacetylase
MSNFPMGSPIVVEGMGLHTATTASVILAVSPGDVRVRVGGVESAVRDLTVVASSWCTTVAPEGGGFRLATVEHLLAALAGLGLYAGVSVGVDGTELPILDGGSLAWCNALTELRAPHTGPRTRIVRHGIVEIGTSRYEFEPFDGIDVEVVLEFSDDRLAPTARWEGDEADFRGRIAPARTFALERDIGTILGLGLARHVPPESALIIRRDRIEVSGRPFAPDEPARHKLLDFIGDLYLIGGPPFGRVRAVRPGHAANAGALRCARADGVIVDVRS